MNAVLLAGVLVGVGAGCGSSTRASAPTTTPSTTAPSPVASSPTTAGPTAPLSVPATSSAEDSRYFVDLAKVDPALSSYVSTRGNVALRALLTDGAAFCGFLAQGHGIDSAMMSLAVGAHSVESETHLPSSVETFNAIDSIALVALCPGEQRLAPKSVQANVAKLTRQLAATATPGP